MLSQGEVRLYIWVRILQKRRGGQGLFIFVFVLIASVSPVDWNKSWHIVAASYLWRHKKSHHWESILLSGNGKIVLCGISGLLGTSWFWGKVEGFHTKKQSSNWWRNLISMSLSDKGKDYNIWTMWQHNCLTSENNNTTTITKTQYLTYRSKWLSL